MARCGKKLSSFCHFVRLFDSNHLFSGHDSSNSLVLVTSIFSSSTDIPKLFSALQHYITNVDFVILQRVGRNGSSSLYNTLSQGKNW